MPRMDQTLAPRAMRQPDGITCGAASLAMTHDFLRRLAGSSSRIGILDLGDLMGTNTTTGTTEKEMGAGMRGLGLDAERHVGDPRAVTRISEAIEAGDMAILRTLTMGYKHWILGHGKEFEEFLVNDPATGPIRLSAGALEGRIRPRDWEWWRVPRNQSGLDLRIDPVTRRPEAPTRAEQMAIRRGVELAARALGLPGGDATALDELALSVDWSLSRVVSVDGVPVGFHLLREGNVASLLPGNAPEARRLAALKGVESVALVVDGRSRGRGYGRLLAAQPGRLGFDYQFASRPHSLGRPKGRVLGEREGDWVTVAPVKRSGFRVPEPGAAWGSGPAG